MTGKRSAPDNAAAFCWEQIARTNNLFRISRVFASPHCADRLLPLYALFSVAEQISSTHSDTEIAFSKLNWWRNECLHQPMAASQHPLVREMVRTGMAHSLTIEGLARLFDGVEARLTASAPSDLLDLKERCIEIYKPQLELELAASAPRISASDYLPGLLARNGLFQLLREGVRRKGQGGYGWIPLNSLARHSVSREEIADSTESENVTRLLKEMCTEGISWGEHSGASPGTENIDFSPARHVFAISGLYARKLKGLVSARPSQFAGKMSRLQPTDLFVAWASARRLR